ncbi:MAG: hypothetical protein GF399_04125 [Candidatus Coatesbacteria bacterium]|nr:hypothetical protein [Candidatus Coatesbacteria bacterium]
MRRICLALVLVAAVVIVGCRPEVDPYVELPGKIVYASVRDEMSQIVLTDPQGEEQTVLTNPSSLRGVDGFYTPCLAPDGRSIVCIASIRGFRELALIELGDPPGVRLITEEGTYKADPVFSPDGTTIYYVSTSVLGDDEVYALDYQVLGAEPVRLTNRRSDDNQLAIDPEGTYLAYVSDQHGALDIYTIDLTGKDEPWRVTDAEGDVSRPVFDPEGDYIIYELLHEGNLDIAYTDFGNAANNGTLIESDEWMEYSPAVSPSGDYILAVTNRDGQTDLCLFTWYGDFVRRITDDEYRDATARWSR